MVARRAKRRWACFSLFLLLLLAGAAIGAPPKLEHLFPAGAARGQQLVVEARGTFDSWPVQAWLDRPGVQVAAAEKKGQLKVTVSPDAACGVYWLRLYDQQGATPLRPFLVDTLPEVVEQEPNDAVAQAQRLDASSLVNGRLERRGDLDGYAIELNAGQQLVVAMQAHRPLGSPMDGVLQICSADGFVLQQNDDALGLDPLLAFVAPSAGSYLVRAFAFPETPDSTIGFSGSNSYVYRLTVTTGGYLDHTLPLALPRGESTDLQLFGWNVPPGSSSLALSAESDRDWLEVFHSGLAASIALPVLDQACLVAHESSGVQTPQEIELPCAISGRIEAAGDADVFQFQAGQGQTLVFRAESDSLGFLLDPLLVLTDAGGKVLSEVDDSNRERDPVLRFKVPADGQYRLLVRDAHQHGGLRYVYRLSAGQERPDFALTLAADSFVASAGKPLEIPVAIDRQAGFAGEIVITATGLPDGVTAEAVKSPAKGDASKSVKLVLRGESGPVSAAIRIAGTAGSEPSIERPATYALGATAQRGKDVWLTVVK